MATWRLVVVAGARPNFMKIAPLLARFDLLSGFEVRLVHTGQHYDWGMNEIFFADLGLREPDIHLSVGSGSHAIQTAAVMVGMEQVLSDYHPHLVIVVGDVNSTLAAALTARKMNIAIAHVEAGLRSRDWTMPEEVNRVVTDVVSDYLFAPSRDAVANLESEALSRDRIFFVGNVMIDTLVVSLPRIKASRAASALNLQPGKFAAVTLHRPSNVDQADAVHALMDALGRLDLHVVFPVHPRTRQVLESIGFGASSNLRLVEPMGYFDFSNLMLNSACVITDSGGIQEETTYLGVPCLTLRATTERPVTVDEGTNELATIDSLPDQVAKVLAGDWKKGRIPELWDGRASERIADVLAQGIERKL